MPCRTRIRDIPGCPWARPRWRIRCGRGILKFNPKDPHWFDRDRFVLSAGHGSMLLYSLLYLTGYDLPLDEMKHFRQWGSKTPGHPERGHTVGRGSGDGSAGPGIRKRRGDGDRGGVAGGALQPPGHTIIDHYTYAICGDGDLMEGVTQEAASLAGPSAAGQADLSLRSESHFARRRHRACASRKMSAKRFEAYGWHTRHVEDGNDTEEVAKAIEEAQGEDRPAVADSGAHAHRLRQPEEAGHVSRRTAIRWAKKNCRRRRRRWAGPRWTSSTCPRMR